MKEKENTAKEIEREKNKERYPDKIERIEEVLQVENRKVETGRVKISKKVLEEEVPISLNGYQEEIEIERKKIGRVVDKPGPAMRKEGDSTVYSLYKEVYVKQIVLEEEVRISKKTNLKSFEGKEKLRKEILDVKRTSVNPPKESKKGKTKI